MGRRRCARRYVLLAAGGVRVIWACGAAKDLPAELAIDVEYLDDHTGDTTHHHHHLHKE